jgi:hypothetical protein
VLPVWWPAADGCACAKPDCAAPAKHPIGPLVRHGVLDAAIASETIVRWWHRFPDANVGIATCAATVATSSPRPAAIRAAATTAGGRAGTSGALTPAALPAWLADVARHRVEPAGALRGRRLLAPAEPADQRTFRELMARAGVVPGGREQEMHRCPWHADEHPSLSVHWTAAVFHCFGCVAGGGIGTLRRLVEGERWPW